MRNYTVENPTFTKAISIVEEDDLVNEENDTAAAKQLIANDLVLNDRMEKCLGKDPEHGDSKELKITFDSGDAASANVWTDVAVIKSGETHKSLFNKISTMFKNVRYLYKLLGSTDISQVGNGTVTGAIKNINTEVGKKVNFTDISQSAAVTVAGQKALDAIEKNASIEGTLANELGKINSKLNDIAYIDIGGADFTNLQGATTFTLGTLSKGKYLIYYFGKFVAPVTKGLDCGIFEGVGQIEETRAVLNNSSGMNTIGYINSPSEITITCRAFADGIANRGYVRACAIKLG